MVGVGFVRVGGLRGVGLEVENDAKGWVGGRDMEFAGVGMGWSRRGFYAWDARSVGDLMWFSFFLSFFLSFFSSDKLLSLTQQVFFG